MSTTDPSLKLLSFLELIKKNGMTTEIYEKIAHEFESIEHLSTPALLCLLRYFVEFDCTPLYVNEIKNYLKEYDNELFMKYGSKFKNCKGCQEIFGIETTAVKEYDFNIVKSIEEPKPKSFDKFRNKHRKDRQIKRKSKNEAAERYKKKLSERNDKKKKRSEIEDLLKKQDL